MAKHLFGIHIADKDVPSERTSLRFADQGHFLAKFQIAEAMVEEEHFDLHIDGMTRDHRKYVGQQITSSSGSLCCGFDEVAAEDSKTLVDITTGLNQEVTEVFDEDEKDQHIRTTQITSSSGSLCCGFDEVAAEDSKTLADITIGLLQEVTEVFDEDEKDQHFRTSLQHLSGLMSDRASVNKAMKRDVNDIAESNPWD